MNRLLLGLILIYCLIANAQAQIKIIGSIVDTKNDPVAFATIQLKDKSEKTLCYTLSDESGVYKLECKQVENWVQIVVNHLNYETLTDTLYFEETVSAIEKVLVLTPKENKLSEVLVKGPERGAEISEDTIRYNLQLNTTGTERNLGEVINKMPGLSVNENGEILAHGKKIENLLLDGKEVFGDNHKTLTQNFDPEMVAGLSLIQKYEPNEMLRGKSGTQRNALNIEINENYKGKWTGEINALGAWQNRYSSSLNSYYFGKDFSLSWINNANNTGVRQFSLEDYVKMSLGTQKNLFENNLSNTRNVDNIPPFLFETGTPESRRSEFTALNYIYQPNEKLKIQGYTLANSGKEEFSEISNKRLIAQNENFEFTDSINSSDNYLFVQNHLNLTWQVSKNYQMDYQINYNPNLNLNNQAIAAENLGNQFNIIQTENKVHKIPFTQQLNHIWSLNSNTYLGASSFFTNQSDKEDHHLNNKLNLFDFDFREINNDRSLNSKHFKQAFYFAKYFGDSRFLLKSEWKNENENINAKSVATTDTVNSFNLQYTVNHLTQSAEWMKSNGDWQYLANLKWQNSFFTDGDETSFAQNFLPDLQLKYSFKPAHYLKFQWGQEMNFVDLHFLNQGFYVEDYRNLQIGSSLRYDDFYKQSMLGFNYFNFDLFNGLLFFVNSSYKYSDESFVRNSTNRFSFNNLEFNRSDEMFEWVNLGHVEWRISGIQHKIKSNVKWVIAERPTLISNEKIHTQTQTLSSQFSFLSMYQNTPVNYEAGLRIKNQSFRFANALQNNISILTPFLGLDGRFSKHILYRTHLNYQYFQHTSYQRELWIWDAQLEFQPNKSNWKFIVEGRDLLNIASSEIVNIYSDANIIATQIQQRLKGYIGIGLSYTWK